MYSASWEFSELDTPNKIFYDCVGNISFAITSTGAGTANGIGVGRRCYQSLGFPLLNFLFLPAPVKQNVHC